MFGDGTGFGDLDVKTIINELLIYGAPGCGKTTICTNLINEHQKLYNRVKKRQRTIKRC